MREEQNRKQEVKGKHSIRRKRRIGILLVEGMIAIVLTVILVVTTGMFGDRIAGDIPISSDGEDQSREEPHAGTAEAEVSSVEFSGTEETGFVAEEEKDPLIYEESGLWVLMNRTTDGGEQREILFASPEDYVRSVSLTAQEEISLEVHNFLGEEGVVTLVMDSGETKEVIGGLVGSGESVLLKFAPEEAGSYRCSVVVRACDGSAMEGYIGSAGALETLYEQLAEAEAGEGQQEQGQQPQQQQLSLPEGMTLTVHMFGSFDTYEAVLGALPYETTLLWNRNAPSLEEISKAANIAAYNGVDISPENSVYGGKSDAILAGARLAAGENGVLTNDLVFDIYGNTACVAVPFYVAEGQMCSMRVSALVEGGTVSFTGEGVNADGTINLQKETLCTVTDQAGQTRTYCLYGKRLAHNIPIVYITTSNGQEITSKYTYLNGSFSMDASHVEGVDSIPEQTIQIRGRGHSTWNRWPKKSYKVKFTEKVSIFGLEKDKDWVLTSNYYDRSLTRNYLAFELSRTLDNMEYTPVSNPVDVFLNGQYVGVYGLGDQVEVGEGKLDIQTNEAEVDSGFLVEVGGNGMHASFSAGLLSNVEIHYPDDPTSKQVTYIANYIREANNAIVNGGNYEDYIDVDSFIDWLILEEFCYNWDAGFTRNVYLYKEPGGKLKFGPVWDFDLSMGSVGYDDWTYQSWATSMNGLVGETWTTHLIEDPVFLEKMKNRWLEVREELMDTVDVTLGDMLIELEPSFEENYWRWMTEVEGQNIAWEWEMEYKQRTLEGLYGYLQSVFDYRYEFLNKCLIEGYVCPKKPKKDDTVEATEALEEEQEG